MALTAQVAPAFGVGDDSPALGDRSAHGGRADVGYSSLMSALLISNTEKVRSILADPSHGIDLDASSTSGVTQGWTPLTLAAAQGDAKGVELLLAKGAKLNQEIQLNHKKVSPLILAAMYDHKEVMKIILTSPGFGSEGYRREMVLAQRFQQPSLVDHLRIAAESEVLAKDSHAILQDQRYSDDHWSLPRRDGALPRPESKQLAD